MIFAHCLIILTTMMRCSWGHDWGGKRGLVNGTASSGPGKKKIINLALPYQARTEKPWIEFMEEFLGGDYYFVHFNRQPGVADTVLDQNTHQFCAIYSAKMCHLRRQNPE